MSHSYDSQLYNFGTTFLNQLLIVIIMKKHGKWTITGSKEFYKNPWIKVREDQVIQPDGKESIFGVVEYKEGICVLAVDANKYTYLIKEFKYALGSYKLQAVTGGIDNETPIECAKRELKEEIGADAGKWTDLGSYDFFGMNIKSKSHLFLATKLKFSEKTPDPNEDIEVLKLALDDAFNLVMNSKVSDGATEILVLKAKEYLASKHYI